MTQQFAGPNVRRHVLANRNYSKIFGIGQNKTGTTTLEAILRYYGYHLPNQHDQETIITKQFFQGNYAPFKDFVAKHDAFQDLPFSQGYTHYICDALFPGSKFILTEREPERWFESLCNFHRKIGDIEDLSTLGEQDVKDKFTYLYGGYSHMVAQQFLTTVEDGEVKVRWDLLYDRDFYIEKYVQRNNEIKAYFKDRPDALLVLDVTKETDTGSLCDFLNISREFAIPMPHMNKT